MIPLPLLGYVLALQVQHAAPLALALHADRGVDGYLDAPGALVQVLAAQAAATPDIPAEVLLALAFRESHFDPLSGPVGHWPAAPGSPPRRRHYICGVTQATFATWSACVAARDPIVGYAAGAAQIQRWAYVCRSRYHARNVLRCALNGYAEGGRAAANGYGVRCRGVAPTCDRAAILLERAARLVHAVARRAPRSAS